jgi:hypothetical protein
MMHRAIRLTPVLRRALRPSSLVSSAAIQFPKVISNAVGGSGFCRSMSTQNDAKPEISEQKEEPKKDNAIAKYDYDEYDDYEEPKTAGGWVRLQCWPRLRVVPSHCCYYISQVKFYATVGFRLSLLALGAVCVYFTMKELFPGRLGPQALFSEAFERVRNHEEVMVMAGDNMKAFGRDVGRNEGRRNHVDSYSYTAEDGSKRTRVRFNVKGDKGKVIVWAEVRLHAQHAPHTLYWSVRATSAFLPARCYFGHYLICHP